MLEVSPEHTGDRAKQASCRHRGPRPAIGCPGRLAELSRELREGNVLR